VIDLVPNKIQESIIKILIRKQMLISLNIREAIVHFHFEQYHSMQSDTTWEEKEKLNITICTEIIY
jgi:hypothetical protein